MDLLRRSQNVLRGQTSNWHTEHQRQHRDDATITHIAHSDGQINSARFAILHRVHRSDPNPDHLIATIRSALSQTEQLNTNPTGTPSRSDATLDTDHFTRHWKSLLVNRDPQDYSRQATSVIFRLRQPILYGSTYIPGNKTCASIYSQLQQVRCPVRNDPSQTSVYILQFLPSHTDISKLLQPKVYPDLSIFAGIPQHWEAPAITATALNAIAYLLAQNDIPDTSYTLVLGTVTHRNHQSRVDRDNNTYPETIIHIVYTATKPGIPDGRLDPACTAIHNAVFSNCSSSPIDVYANGFRLTAYSNMKEFYSNLHVSQDALMPTYITRIDNLTPHVSAADAVTLLFNAGGDNPPSTNPRTLYEIENAFIVGPFSNNGYKSTTASLVLIWMHLSHPINISALTSLQANRTPVKQSAVPMYGLTAYRTRAQHPPGTSRTSSGASTPSLTIHHFKSTEKDKAPIADTPRQVEDGPRSYSSAAQGRPPAYFDALNSKPSPTPTSTVHQAPPPTPTSHPWSDTLSDTTRMAAHSGPPGFPPTLPTMAVTPYQRPPVPITDTALGLVKHGRASLADENTDITSERMFDVLAAIQHQSHVIDQHAQAAIARHVELKTVTEHRHAELSIITEELRSATSANTERISQIAAATESSFALLGRQHAHNAETERLERYSRDFDTAEGYLDDDEDRAQANLLDPDSLPRDKQKAEAELTRISIKRSTINQRRAALQLQINAHNAKAPHHPATPHSS